MTTPTRARRELATAVALCLAGAGLTLLAAGQTWATVQLRQPPLPATVVALSGRALAPGVAVLGLVALAGVVGVAATRRVGRVGVGLVLLAAGAVVLTGSRLDATQVRGSAALREQAPVAALRGVPVQVDLAGWRHVATAGGAFMVAAGLLTVVRGARWAALSGRYERTPATRSGRRRDRPAPLDPERELWARLDRGDDPTA